MAKGVTRMSDLTESGIWRLPDAKTDPAEGYISIRLPTPFMRLPGADEFTVPSVTIRRTPWVLDSKKKWPWPFDTGLISPKMPASIRNRFMGRLIRDILKERERARPAIKAPPKENGGKKKTSCAFGGTMRVDKPLRTTPKLHSHAKASLDASIRATGQAATTMAPLAVMVYSAMCVIA